MRRKIFFALVYTALLLTCAFAAEDTQSPLALNTRLSIIRNIEPIRSSDRILILAPHPDDEAIGCAGIIQAAAAVGADTHVLYLTNGDNNEFAFIVYDKRIPVMPSELVRLGEVRRSEAIKAMKTFGVDEYNLIFLGYPDFGTFQIFKDFWEEGKPYKSMLTRKRSVPYKNDPSFGAPYIGQSILMDLKNTLLRYKPNKVFVSHPADLNRDHKTLYLFLEIALADLTAELPRPRVYHYLVHWRAWPMPRHYHPELPLLPPDQFRPTASDIRWLKYRLTQQQVNNKYKAILVYKSQTQVSAFYLLAFGRKNELFSIYPDINVDIAPQAAEKKKVSLKDRIGEKISAFFGLSGNFEQAGQKVAVVQRQCPVVYGSEDNCLLIRMYKRKDIGRTLKTVIYLFGYSSKTPFGQMPKILILTKHTRFKMLDGKKVIVPEGIDIQISPEELTVKIPFSVLGDPDFILASVHGNGGVSCPDTVSFRKINIRRKIDGI
ncbi:MAG: PIG-L family deacetylase [Candidatus Omnitrophota bacterium]